MEYIEPRGTNKHQKKVSLYRCKCGNEFEAVNTRVKSGHTTTCGCSRGEKHGDKGTRLYNIWTNIKARCQRENHPQYKNYGGRGIDICFDWRLYSKFKEWALENGYEEHLTIDRRNNNSNYRPQNCRWVDHNIQNANRRISSSNKVGYIGIFKNYNNYAFQVKYKETKKVQYGFKTVKEAVLARDKYIVDNNLPNTRDFKACEWILKEKKVNNDK